MGAEHATAQEIKQDDTYLIQDNFVAKRSKVENVDDYEIDFGDQVVVAYAFWKDHVDAKDRQTQKQIGLLLFSNLFKKAPVTRELFAGTDIGKQSLKLLDMFGWLLRSMVKGKNKMRGKTLADLGSRHVTYKVRTEYFGPMLDSLNEALLDICNKKYTVRARVALTNLFRNAVNQMMLAAKQPEPFKQTEQGKLAKQIAQSEKRWLKSLDHCLSDPLGFVMLDKYCQQQYMPELTAFHQAYAIYRSCLSPSIRYEIADELMKMFFTKGAKLELNNSGDISKKIAARMVKCDQMNDDYPIDLFDEAHLWMKYMISQNAWFKFYYAMKGGKKPLDISSGSYKGGSYSKSKKKGAKDGKSRKKIADNVSQGSQRYL